MVITQIESAIEAEEWCAKFTKSMIHKETKHLCVRCKYGADKLSKYPTCDYFLMTGKRRETNWDGSCACFEKGKRRKTKPPLVVR